MVTPVPGVSISTPYGQRGKYWSCDADKYGNGIHTGADFAAPVGTGVVAARPGTARYCNHGSAFGYHQLEVRAGDGTRDFYAHMTTRTVADGATVTAGQAIGKVGAEGNVTGPHLHFERHATETGGWSCSVVRDPAPSINYAAASSSGSGAGAGTDEDMPEYAYGKSTKDVKLSSGNWHVITWDPSSNSKYFDGNGILASGATFSAVLSVKVTGADKGAVLQTNFVEFADGAPQQTYPVASHGTVSNAVDGRIGVCQKGRRLRARVRMYDGGGTLDEATVTLLLWR